MLGRHTVLRKELFAHRRELLIWTSWGLLTSAVNVVIVWYGGYLNVIGQRHDRRHHGVPVVHVPADEPGVEPGQLVLRAAAIAGGDGAGVRSARHGERQARSPGRARSRRATVHEIRFEDVEFEYREGQPVVRDFNVVVPGGSVVALVGRSGAGKTTVTDLVARFHDPTRGRILLNGTDIRDFKLATYRNLLAIVQQDVFLFDGSARDNIAYGRRDATADAGRGRRPARQRPRVHRAAARASTRPRSASAASSSPAASSSGWRSPARSWRRRRS